MKVSWNTIDSIVLRVDLGRLPFEWGCFEGRLEDIKELNKLCFLIGKLKRTHSFV